ncbi:hypothetical protein A8C56_02805 [Niabella ginsenosidivorans]|uniref:Peptidase S74 domain-containing protein n=1 Tax=Niabella ginsenosidivorans TaxID=1176587 RepID=A0A1A9HXT2_9BACT|nr:hypothetical protein A8C56_02805 [Niabella ginsenosidivorans]
MLLLICKGQTNVFPTTGNVGIGTTTPVTPIDVKGDITVDAANPALRLSTSSTDQNRYLAILNSKALGAAGGLKAGGVLISESYAYANPAKGDLVVKGNISIGRATPVSGYKLAVAGKAIAEEMKVQLQSGWPDYVFKPDYQLMPLKNVESFIKKHGHLPEVPSAKEVAENGIEVGANQAVLLKKIEELMLHLIEMEKKVKQQQEDTERKIRELEGIIKQQTAIIEQQNKTDNH